MKKNSYKKIIIFSFIFMLVIGAVSVFAADVFSITYVLNGGINSELNPAVYECSEKNIKLYKPTKEGYKFKGWFLQSDFDRKSKVSKIKKNTQGDLTLYAYFMPNKYNIKYKPNGAAGKAYAQKKCTYPDSLMETTFVKTGYELAGWTSLKNGTEALYNKNCTVAEVFKGSKKKSIVLYPVWQKKVIPAEPIDPEPGDDDDDDPVPGDDPEYVPENAVFVSISGNDSNAGSIEKPFRTIAAALENIEAGKTIYIREGVYKEQIEFEKSGLENAYITISAYKNEKPKVTLPEGKSGAIFDLGGEDYIVINGLDIGSISGKEVYGILLSGDEKHIYITNNDIHDIVTTMPDGDGESNAILLLGEKSDEAGAISNVHIKNNVVHDNINGWSENISVAGNCEYIYVKNNTVYDCTNIGIDFYGNAGYCKNAALDHPRNCLAAGNLVYNCVCSYAECAGIYVDGSRNITISNNEVYANAYGIEVGSEEKPKTDEGIVSGIIVDNNNIHDNTVTGLIIGGYTTTTKTGVVMDCVIRNNTFKNNGRGEDAYNGELCFEKCDGIDIYANEFFKKGTEYPYIGSQMNGNYVLNIKLHDNIFHGDADPEDIYFELPIDTKVKTIEGMSAYKALSFTENETYIKTE